jgi:peptide/nickel transport system substrate-binding protein
MIRRHRRTTSWRPVAGPSAVTFGWIVLLAAGCSADDSRGGPAAGGQVVLAEQADLDRPHPLVSESVLDAQLNTMLYRPLLAPSWEDGELIFSTADENPLALARSYEFFGPDSASLRYHLRSDVRWSDGLPVTAHDAVWTLKTRGIPEVASPRFDYNREITEVVAEDDSTLVIHFTRRYPAIFYHTAGEIAPRHVYEGHDVSQLRSHPALTNPVQSLVTNGPFRLAQWRQGQEVVLERSPDFEPQPHLERIVIRIIPEETTRIIELQTGNVDMTQLPHHIVPELRELGGIRIEAVDQRAYEYIAWNSRAHAFLADPEVRRALGLAIDVPALIEALEMEDFAVPAGGPYPQIFRLLYDEESQAPLPYDPAEASRILAEKGWAPGPDGILRKDGERFSFEVLTNAENRRRVDVAQILQAQWRRIGIEAELQTMEFNTVTARSRERDFEARIGGWNVGLSPSFISELWGDPSQQYNDTSYDNPELRRLFDLAIAQPTDQAAAPYWSEAAGIIVRDQPYTFLYYYDLPYGIRDRLRGTLVNTLGQYQRPWEWYIEE